MVTDEYAILMSDLLPDEGFLAETGPARFVDCRDLQETCCYCSGPSLEALRGRLAGIPFSGLHWIDTGDYHYLTALFMEKIHEPFELVLLDHHPDDQPMAFEEPGMLSCGSWVLWARQNLPMMRPPSPEPLPVYLSVDLDILSPDLFSTDWDQGDIGMEELWDMIASRCRGRRILGVDVCGGLTRAKGASDAVLERNAAVRSAFRQRISSL